jgi:hypothetical protein
MLEKRRDEEKARNERLLKWREEQKKPGVGEQERKKRKQGDDEGRKS